MSPLAMNQMTIGKSKSSGARVVRWLADKGPASAQATVRVEAGDGSRLEIGMVQTSLLLQWPWDSQAKK